MTVREPLEEHDCDENGCFPPAHVSLSGLCLVCGGCGDPACCVHDDECYDDRTYPLGNL